MKTPYSLKDTSFPHSNSDNYHASPIKCYRSIAWKRGRVSHLHWIDLCGYPRQPEQHRRCECDRVPSYNLASIISCVNIINSSTWGDWDTDGEGVLTIFKCPPSIEWRDEIIAIHAREIIVIRYRSGKASGGWSLHVDKPHVRDRPAVCRGGGTLLSKRSNLQQV